MTVISPTIPESIKRPLQSRPRRRLFTIEEYERAGEAGVFRPDERLELIEGEIITKMSPQRTPHAVCIELGTTALQQAYGKGFRVRIQLPLNIGLNSQPEPDFAVIPGQPRDSLGEHPREAVLVLEIADTTLSMDTGRKAALYASAGIPEYWVLDLKNRKLILYRDPMDATSKSSAANYQSVQTLTEKESVQPEGSTQRIRVADLLP